MGFTVAYDPDTWAVTCRSESHTARFALGESAYTVDGAALTLDANARAEDGITYLPLRALGEALGCTVNWNDARKPAQLTTGR